MISKPAIQRQNTMPTKSRRARAYHPHIAIVCAAMLSSAGCSMINPHIKPKVERPGSITCTVRSTATEPIDPQAGDTPGVRSPAKVYSGSGADASRRETSIAADTVFVDPGEVPLQCAVQYANSMKDQYRSAIGDEATFQRLLGIGLVGLSGAAMGLGITGGSQDVITGLALGSASALGLGTWLESRPRRFSYVAGYNAINCAVAAVAPLRFASSRGLDGKIAALDAAMEGTSQAASTVRLELALYKDDKKTALVAPAEADLVTAGELVSSARETRKAAVELQRDESSAGDALVGATDRIIGEVDQAIVVNQPDLTALAAVVGGLAQAYGMFSSVPDAAKSASDLSSGDALREGAAAGDITPEAGSPAVAPNSTARLRGAMTTLVTRAATLDTARRALADVINAVASASPLDTLAKCGVDPDQLITNITVTPSSVTAPANKASSWPITIQGGKSPYLAQVLPESEHFSAKSTEPFGPAWMISIKDSVPEGKYQIYVVDGSGRRAFVPLNVEEASDAPGGDTPQRCTAPPDPEFNAENEENRKKIQRALCLAGDDENGIWGCKTRNALIKYQEIASPEKTDGVLTNSEKTTLLAMTAAQILADCPRSPPPTDDPPDGPPTPSPLQSFADELEDKAITVEGDEYTVDDATVENGKVNVTLTPKPPVASHADVKRGLIALAGAQGAGIVPDQITIVE